MSVSLFYPDNHDRAKRVITLVDDIAGMQREIKTDVDNITAAQARSLDLFNGIMEKNGLITIDQLMDRVTQALPEEEQDRIREMLKGFAETDENMEKAFGVVSIVAMLAGGTFAVTGVAHIIASGALFVSTYYLGKALVALVAGGADGAAMASRYARAAFRTGKALSESFGSFTRVGRAMRAMRTVSKSLLLLGFAIDTFLVIIAAIVGARQRDELQDAIDVNFERRVNVAFLTELMKSALATLGMVENILFLESEKTGDADEDALIQRLMDKQTERLVDAVETDWESKSYSSAAKVWTYLDSSRGSWTNEDPSLEEVIARLEAEEDVTGIDSDDDAVTSLNLAQSVTVGTEYKWIEELCYLPATISCNVTAQRQSGSFLPVFSLSRAQWPSQDCDALCWFLSPHRNDFTFRTQLFRSFPKNKPLGSSFRMMVGEPVNVECSITATSARYKVNGLDYASCTYSDGVVPKKGNFGFAAYGNSAMVVKDIKITHK